MSESQERELIQFLNGPEGAIRLDERSYFRLANDISIDPLIRQILGFHALGTKYAHDAAGTEPLPLFADADPDQPAPPEDEVVEDAGLFDHERPIEAEGISTD